MAMYLGPDRAGSTWLYETCKRHPEVHVPRSKDLYFFDRYYHKGFAWYERQFRAAPPSTRLLLDISHDYLDSRLACARIAARFPDARLLVFAREPVQRAISAYAYWRKQGLLGGSFAAAIQNSPEIVVGGEYGTALDPYYRRFPADQIRVLDFQDLVLDPVGFSYQIFTFLGVRTTSNVPANRVRPTSASRSITVSKYVKMAARVVRSMGFPDLVGRIKDSSLVDKLLYTEGEPVSEVDLPNQALLDRLKDWYRPEVVRLSELTGNDFVSRWNY